MKKHDDVPDNLIAFMRPDPAFDSMPDFTDDYSWKCELNRQLDDLRNEILMTNGLIRRLLLNIKKEQADA